MADIYFAYGRALLENAIAQSSVLGKEQQQQQEGGATAAEGISDHLTDGDSADCVKCFCPHAEPAPNGNKILSFSGDAEDEEDGEDHDHDPAVDLFAEASKPDVEGEEEAGEGGDADEAEPEDDFNAAWEVLDLARAIYEKQMDGNDEMRLKVADTFIMLGDISLETGACIRRPGTHFFFLFLTCPKLKSFTFLLFVGLWVVEKFEQAITDYSSGIALKTELLPLSSRQLAEGHYKLSIALDLTAGRLADAIHHAQRALESIEARLVELRAGLAGTLPPLPEPSDTNGKGKGKQVTLAQEELVQNRSKAQIEAEIKELGELKQDLALKVCLVLLPTIYDMA